jgi:radical SAM protein (TIGR04043 family)
MDAEEVLRLKIRLLTEGAVLPKSEWKGRKGGAGPVGGRYFLLPNGKVCGIPIRSGKTAKRYGSATLEQTDDPEVWLYDNRVELKLVPKPQFYNLHTKDGIPYYNIALLHGNETLATTVYQSCRYWDDGSHCRFCTIPHSFEAGNTLMEKTPEQIGEVLLAAEKEGVVRDVLLTTGTPDSSDMGCERLVSIIQHLKSVSSLPIAVQFEPPYDMDAISSVAEAGAVAVGIHIESADEAVRAKMCPGKTAHGDLELYWKSWKHALAMLGRGSVSTFILTGLGEDETTTLQFIELLSESGILPVVTPVRPSAGSRLASFTPTYIGQLDATVDFYKKVGEVLGSWGLDPSKTPAGCHRCGGCTPIQEAFDLAKS